MTIARLASARYRPYIILALVILLLTVIDGRSDFLTVPTAYSALQSFATYGLVALGLGLTMVIGEFDLSVAGVFGLAGCIAVLTGNENAWLGLLCALGAGVAFGLVQGLIITRIGIGSVPVTLGGLLTATGLAYLVTQNQTLSFDNIDLALALNNPIACVFSVRSTVAIAIFVAAAFIFGATRIGRDLVASGSDRRAAMTAGVPVGKIVTASFTLSGALAAIGGSLLSYGLASAAPSGLSDVLVPAIAATILGGVSLAGGVGSPFGIAAGVLTLTVLRSGLNALAAPPFAHELAIGAILVIVAIADAPYLMRRLSFLTAWR